MRAYHKNSSFRIIPKILEQYYIYDNKDFKSLIYNHDDVRDFLGYVKAKGWTGLYASIKDNRLVYDKINEKVIRYIPSNKGGALIKWFPDGRKHKVEASTNISIHQKYDSIDPKDYDINYKWFVSKVREEIHRIPITDNLLLF